MKRHNLIALALGGATLGSARAQTPTPFPSKPIRIIPFGEPGGPPDVLARVFGERMTKAWGQPTVIETKPGAGGMLAADAVAKAAPDGHTLLLTLANTQVILPHLLKLPYDPMTDFQPLTPIAIGGPVLIVRADAPCSNITEYVSWVKAKGRVTCGTWGQGTSAHLFTELLKVQAGVNIEHVPYKGQGQAHIDLLGGILDSAWANPAAAKTLQAGAANRSQIKILGITGSRRVPVLPNTPTFNEQGFKSNFGIDSWFGFLAPARTPRPIVDQLVAKLHATVLEPEVSARLIEFGLEPLTSTPEHFAARQRSDLPIWGDLVKASGIKPS
jgi:tripartite-type tricarboxylate transporter receptor subunit TctC